MNLDVHSYPERDTSLLARERPLLHYWLTGGYRYVVTLMSDTIVNSIYHGMTVII